jgi:hypothetical protein
LDSIFDSMYPSLVETSTTSLTCSKCKDSTKIAPFCKVNPDACMNTDS